MSNVHTDETLDTAPSEVQATADRIAGLYARVLGIQEVGRNDDFFVLGGTSLSAMELLDRIADEIGVRLPVRDFYHSTCVADLAVKVHALANDTSR